MAGQVNKKVVGSRQAVGMKEVELPVTIQNFRWQITARATD